jgi:hypothetical protein
MTKQMEPGGSFTLSGTSIGLKRMGYGAMQLAGPQVWGPPRDPDAAIAVLREAVAAGVNHIDTSDYYGPHVTNRIINRRFILMRRGWSSSPKWAPGGWRTSPGSTLFRVRN